MTIIGKHPFSLAKSFLRDVYRTRVIIIIYSFIYLIFIRILFPYL